MQTVSDMPEFDNHELVTAVHDAATGLRGYIAVHTTRPGQAVGGTRLLAYASPAAALADVLRLSRAMSYKCALAGLPYGGAKAVIICPATGKSPNLLRAYARVVENFGGLFRTGTDVGISDDDVRTMAGVSRYMVGAQTLDDPSLPTTSEMAAQGVFYAIQAALAHATGRPDVAGRRVAVKGLGKLGGHLANLLHAGGAQLVVADIDRQKVDGITAGRPEISVLPPGQIHTAAVDVYAPCALGGDLAEPEAASLNARIVAGGANNQLANPGIAGVLSRRGILYVPDYVANAGGLIHVTAELEPGGYNLTTVQTRTQGIADTVRHILRQAEAEGRTTEAVAQEIAEAKIWAAAG